MKSISSGSRNFKTEGHGPGAVESLGMRFVLMPLHTIPYVFVARVVNKTKIKVYACYTVKINKNKPVFFSKRGGGPGSAFEY